MAANTGSAASHKSAKEGRNPKAEIRKKFETRRPKNPRLRHFRSPFGFRISAFLRISDFGLRISLSLIFIFILWRPPFPPSPRQLYACTPPPSGSPSQSTHSPRASHPPPSPPAFSAPPR